MPSLAERVALSGVVDARAIGAAVWDLHVNPLPWLDRGSQSEALQELKLLWHVVVKCGSSVHDEGQLRKLADAERARPTWNN